MAGKAREALTGWDLVYSISIMSGAPPLLLETRINEGIRSLPFSRPSYSFRLPWECEHFNDLDLRDRRAVSKEDTHELKVCQQAWWKEKLQNDIQSTCEWIWLYINQVLQPRISRGLTSRASSLSSKTKEEQDMAWAVRTFPQRVSVFRWKSSL